MIWVIFKVFCQIKLKKKKKCKNRSIRKYVSGRLYKKKWKDKPETKECDYTRCGWEVGERNSGMGTGWKETG